MANQVDWGQLSTLPGPGAEIASISNMLGAFAENRQRQQQQAQARAMAERQFAAQQANIVEDNRRAQADLELRRQQEQRIVQAAKAEATQKQGEAFNEGLPAVQAALRNDDLQGARMAAEPLGGDVVEDYAHKEAAGEAQTARGQQMADFLVPYAGLGGLVFPPQAQALMPQMAAEPTAEERASRYKIHGPAGKVLDYSPYDAQQAEARAAAESRQRVETAAGGLQLPHGSRIAPVAGALAELGEKPDEALAKGIGSAQTAEIQGNTDRRAALSAARAGTAKPITPGQKFDDEMKATTTAHSLLTAELNREDYKDILSGARDTQKMLDNLESNNPAAHKLATGIWAKQASGPGAVQQSEREEFVNTVGGKDESLKKLALQWLGGGRVPEGQRKIFADAARNIIMRRQAQTLGEIRENIHGTFATHPNAAMHPYADWAADLVAPSIIGKRKKGGPAAEETKTGNDGKKYVKRNGEWEEAD